MVNPLRYPYVGFESPMNPINPYPWGYGNSAFAPSLSYPYTNTPGMGWPPSSDVYSIPSPSRKPPPIFIDLSQGTPQVMSPSNGEDLPLNEPGEIQQSKRLRHKPNVVKDVLLDYSPLDKLIHAAKTVFVTTPKTVVRGLKGADDFSFSEMMLLTKIPYYLGGAVLTLSFLRGGNMKEGLRQGAAVLMYLAGIAGTNAAIDGIYKAKTGIDLGMLYRNAAGHVEKVFASADFPRFDLLQQRHYDKMATKMGIPDDVNESDGAVREQIRVAINRSRAMKLIIGNLVSAIGAGYIARSPEWSAVGHLPQTIRAVWRDPSLHVGQKLLSHVGVTFHTLAQPFIERLNVWKAPAWKQATVYGGAALLAATALFTWFGGIQRRHYSRFMEGPLDERAQLTPDDPFSKLVQQNSEAFRTPRIKRSVLQ